MTTTKDSIKKMLEQKRQGTKNQGSLKRADKNLGKGGQTSNNQRSAGATVNKSI
ncbi:MAG: hypothetical protein FWF59_06980 [Turicibacter sp.]|nr:hypothetical protein [Turicibacter sp.]